ncbi:hypothetical protein [Nonomuraea sp. NPDC003709]|uniref:hypothetical protein n=1 Tax=Nonomuraea sp. NPDC003709 TaxID=3154450 RepID=UPI0033B07974
MGTWAAYLACQASSDAERILPAGVSWGPDRWEGAVAPGWSVAETEILAVGDPEAILAQTSGHALMAFVLDSDFAHVMGAVDGRTHWELYLNGHHAEAYDAPLPEVPHVQDADLHRRITVWIKAATGNVVSPDQVRKVICTRRVFADDALRSLLYVFGIVTEHMSFGDDLSGLP